MTGRPPRHQPSELPVEEHSDSSLVTEPSGIALCGARKFRTRAISTPAHTAVALSSVPTHQGMLMSRATCGMRHIGAPAMVTPSDTRRPTSTRSRSSIRRYLGSCVRFAQLREKRRIATPAAFVTGLVEQCSRLVAASLTGKNHP